MSDIVSFDLSQRPRLYEAVVDEVKSPEKASSYQVTYDQHVIDNIPEDRRLPPEYYKDLVVPRESVQLSAGGYDLHELRKRLEQRMEYSKVKPLPHDAAMDPDETIPSYATSTGAVPDRGDMPETDSSRQVRMVGSSDED